ncbi:putative Clp, repeat (R) domain, Clp domain superfamily protein [Helianthus annuus]|nr:putative Clp, repeat (R) domain, Clp domain superfamily protein [Helianthus annuus]
MVTQCSRYDGIIRVTVISESAGLMLGLDLESLMQRARDYNKEYGNSFVSVEHLVLGFVQDNRFGKPLFKEFQISLKTLNSAIESIRGRQTIIDQGIYSLFMLRDHVKRKR